MQTLTCGTWDLVPWPGIDPGAPALGAQSLSHQTTKEAPKLYFSKLSFVLKILYNLCDEIVALFTR